MATVLQVGGYAKLVLSVGNWAWHLSISCCSNIVPGEAALSSLGAGFGLVLGFRVPTHHPDIYRGGIGCLIA